MEFYTARICWKLSLCGAFACASEIYFMGLDAYDILYRFLILDLANLKNRRENRRYKLIKMKSHFNKGNMNSRERS